MTNGSAQLRWTSKKAFLRRSTATRVELELLLNAQYDQFVRLLEMWIEDVIVPITGSLATLHTPVTVKQIRGGDVKANGELLLEVNALLNEIAPEKERFRYFLTTKFVEFDAEQKIVHSVQSEISHYQDLSRFPLTQLHRALPLEFQEMKCDIDLFRPRSWGARMGISPTVEKKITLSATSDSLKLVVADDASDTAAPFATDEHFSRVLRALARSKIGSPALLSRLEQPFEAATGTWSDK